MYEGEEGRGKLNKDTYDMRERERERERERGNKLNMKNGKTRLHLS